MCVYEGREETGATTYIVKGGGDVWAETQIVARSLSCAVQHMGDWSSWNWAVATGWNDSTLDIVA